MATRCIFKGLEAALVRGVLGRVRTTRAQQKAKQLRGHTHPHTHEDEEDHGQVVFKIHHDWRPSGRHNR